MQSDKYFDVGLYSNGVGRVFDRNGNELPVKPGNSNKQVNYKGKKYSVSKLPVRTSPNDPVFDYIFCGGSVTHPCVAMDYWIYRWRMKNKISVSNYMAKFNIRPIVKS